MSEAAPAVTALMPLRAYHRVFLDHAVQSLQQQTSQLWQAKIIVEPGDRAKFMRVLAEPLQDIRIELVENRGRKLAGAINTGIAAAVTPFVAILLADDCWATTTVEALSDAIARYPGADFFHSSRRYIDEKGAFISSVHHCRVEAEKLRATESSSTTSARM